MRNSDATRPALPAAMRVSASSVEPDIPMTNDKPVHEQQAGDHREQEVLQRAFEAALALAVEAHQHVRGHGRGLQSEQQHDPVLRARHEHGAERGEQRQRRELRARPRA